MRGLFARPARRTDSSDVRLILVIGALVLVFVQHGALRWKRFTVLDETVQSRAGHRPVASMYGDAVGAHSSTQEHCDFSVSTVVS